jgi:hypothetical protein
MIKRLLLIAGLCSFANATVCSEIPFSHGKFITGSLLSSTVMTVSWAMNAHSSMNPWYRAAITGSVLVSMLVNSFITRMESRSTEQRAQYHAPSFIGGFFATPMLLWFTKHAINM